MPAKRAGNSDGSAPRKIIGRPFKKGTSGNPSGRPKAPEWFKDHSEEAQTRLLHWLRSRNAKASMQAATLILAYGFGKPTEHHEINGKLSVDFIKILDGADERAGFK